MIEIAYFKCFRKIMCVICYRINYHFNTCKKILKIKFLKMKHHSYFLYITIKKLYSPHMFIHHTVSIIDRFFESKHHANFEEVY